MNNSVMEKLVHISPTMPPAVNGLGDFCSLLANNMQRKGYKDNVFFLRFYDFENTLESEIVKFTPENFYENLLKHKPSAIILHYVGYGYNAKGLPFYLVRGLEEYKKKEKCKVLVYFHELYSSSTNPLQLPFYTNFLQKRIVKKLYSIADITFTNCELYQELLYDLTPVEENKNFCTGMCSNIPEHMYDPSMEKEESTMLVFGSFERRNAVYQNLVFKKLMERLGIENIYDIGPGKPSLNHSEINFYSKGPLTAKEVAFYLNKAKYGAIDYPPHLLGKSGIFSAYCGFGVIPINTSQEKKPLYDGLIEGKNYFNPDTDFENVMTDYKRVKKEISAWYKLRDQNTIANSFIKQLEICGE